MLADVKGFRWVKPAASLKPVPARVGEGVKHRFRWVKPAASLKRWPFPLPPPGRSEFPLGKTGGLIEAQPDQCDAREGNGGFRWVKPAASLKQLGRLRRRKERGLVSAG